MLTSGSPLPCSAPAMKGLSSGTLQKVTILAQPMESWAAVRLRHVEQHVGHAHHGVHVDAGPRGGHVDRRADAPRFGDGLGDGVDEGRVAAREALLDERREAADEVDADLARRPRRGRARPRRRRRGSPLPTTPAMGVTDTRRLTIGTPYFSWISSGDRAPAGRRARRSCRGRARRPAADVARRAVAERDAHGDGPHVEVLDLDHADGLEDLFVGDEDHGGAPARCGA